MDLANSLRWPEYFALDNSRLCAMINTKSRTTTIAAVSYTHLGRVIKRYFHERYGLDELNASARRGA